MSAEMTSTKNALRIEGETPEGDKFVAYVAVDKDLRTNITEPSLSFMNGWAVEHVLRWCYRMKWRVEGV